MEQNFEIKDAVKQQVIKLMAEQITKESAFAELKSEIITEMFSKKETSIPVDNSKEELDSVLQINKPISNPIEQRNQRMSEMWEKIEKWKKGTFPKNLIEFYNDKVSDKEEDLDTILSKVVGDKYVYKPDYFHNYLVGCYYKEEQKILFRESVLERIQSGNFNASFIKTSINNHISRYVYEAKGSNPNNFKESIKIDILANKLHNTSNLVIDTACITCDGITMMNEDIGIEVLSKVMNAIEAKVNQAETVELKAKNDKPKKTRKAQGSKKDRQNH